MEKTTSITNTDTRQRQLAETLEMLSDIAESISFTSIVTPVNFEEARDEWIKTVVEKGEFENPSFLYNENTLSGASSKLDPLSVVRDRLESLLDADTPAANFVKKAALESVDDLMNTCLLASSITMRDDAASAKTALNLYGYPKSALIESAYDLANGGDGKIELPIVKQLLYGEAQKEATADEFALNPQELQQMFEDGLRAYGFLGDWNAPIGDEKSAICVELKPGTGSYIYVPASRKPVTLQKAAALLGHELECHVRHNMNTAALLEEKLGAPRILARFIASKRNGLLTEGLAKLSDTRIGLLCTGKGESKPLPWHGIAINMALHGATFSETAKELYRYLIEKKSPEKAALDAWKFTFRCYRGCTSLSKNEHNYAITQGISYIEGYLQATELTKKHPSAINYGKLNPEDFEEISNILGESIDGIAPKYPLRDLAYQRVLDVFYRHNS